MEKITFLSMDRVMLNSDKNIPMSDSFVGSNLMILTLVVRFLLRLTGSDLHYYVM